MAVNMRELYDMTDRKEFQLLAGEEGLGSHVRWVHMVETMEIATFLRGNELVFITGVGLRNETELVDLIRLLHEKGACGVVVNIGPYIDEVSEEIVNFCNDVALPLFLVPWHVHMAEIMRIFSFNISEGEKVESELTEALKNILFHVELTDTYMPYFKKHGITERGPFTLALVEVTLTAKEASKVRLDMTNQLQDDMKKLIILGQQDRYLLLFYDVSSDQVEKHMNTIHQILINKFPGLSRHSVGIGQTVETINEITKSYTQAVKAAKLAATCKNQVSSYQKLGLYKLYLGIEDDNIVRTFYEECLKPILDYDRSKEGDLMTVLEAYVEANGSIKTVSETLFMHRNTIHYKIKKVEELLNCSLADWSTRTRIHSAILLGKVMAS